MSATSPPLSGNLEGKKDADDRKKSRCPSPTPLDGPSSREDDENPHFKRSDGKTKFDIEHLKKIQISCSFKRRQPLASGGGGNTFDPSLITPVRRPGEGKVPIFSRLTVINQRDENDYLEQRKPKPEQRNESKPSSSGTQSTRPRSLSRSRRSAKRLPDPYRNRDEFIRSKKEHMRRLRQEKRIRKSGHSRHSRSKSPSSSDSDSSTGSERSRSSRSRSRERRSSEGRSRTRSKSRDRRRRDRSRDRSRDNRRSDETNPREMVPYPMGPGHWIGPRPYPPPYAMLPGPIYPYPPFRPHIPPYLRPHRLMNWRP